MWLFYVQHQFEMIFWAHYSEWTFPRGCTRRSSSYDLTGFLRWFTANIGMHHVHHQYSRIPFTRQPRALSEGIASFAA
jgi:omega-6 fatty acid desaturase (delta-12 desaturase)